MIMDAENTDFSHVAISFGAFVYHAKWPKFKVQTWSSFQSEYKVVKQYAFAVPEHKELSVLNYLEDQVGKKYSILQLIVIGLGLLSKSVERRLRKQKINGHKRLICSEAAATLMTICFGVNFMESVDTIGLRDVQSMLEALENGEAYGDIWLP